MTSTYSARSAPHESSRIEHGSFSTVPIIITNNEDLPSSTQQKSRWSCSGTKGMDGFGKRWQHGEILNWIGVAYAACWLRSYGGLSPSWTGTSSRCYRLGGRIGVKNGPHWTCIEANNIMRAVMHYTDAGCYRWHLYTFALQPHSKLRTKRKGMRETIPSMTTVVRPKVVIEGAYSLGLDQDHLDS